MESNEFYIIAKDGLKLHGRLWAPEENIRSVISLVHDLGEHIGRYENFASFMTGKGHAVIGLDIRGHGHSQGKRGYAGSMEILMADIGDLLIEARRSYLELPLFLLGHGLGGTLAASYLIKQKSQEISGLILSSPMFKPCFRLQVRKKWIGDLLNAFTRRFTYPVNLDPDELSNNPEINRLYREDPLVHDYISKSIYDICNEGGSWVIQNASKLILPVLLYHGSADKISSPEGSLEFTRNSGNQVRLRLWENMKHETHHDPENEIVMNYINDWIMEIIHKPRGGNN